MQPTKLVIVAATGGVGRSLLHQATAAAHDITAIVRDATKLPPATTAVTADLAVAQPSELAPAMAGAEAVLSALGARSNAEAGIASRGTRTLIEAMAATGVRRIVVVSSAAIFTVPSPARPHPPERDPGNGTFMRHLVFPLLHKALRSQYADLALMEDIVRDSGTDWTVVRPNRLTNRKPTGRYRTADDHNVRHGRSISRGDVAHLMLRTLDRPDTIGQTIAVAR